MRNNITDHGDFNSVTNKLSENLEQARDYMKKTKPKIYKKLMSFLEKQRKDIYPRVSLLDWGYGLECNFSCEHCGTGSLGGHNLGNQTFSKRMPMDVVRRVADEADELGFFTMSFIGGEPLVWRELDDLIKTVDSKRFYITILTNGWHLSEERAGHLADVGVNKIGISIDSGIPGEHDSFRQKPGAFERAVKAVHNAMNAGLRIHISTTVTHQNLRSEGVKKLLVLSNELDVSIDLQCATVAGQWQGNYDVLLDDEDANYILELRKEYPLIRRDLFPTPGGKGGCPALTGSVFLTSSGEVVPCLFIHISLGNVYKDSLKTILERGASVAELRKDTTKCLAGEDMEFIDKYLSRTFGASNLPLSFEDGFKKRSV
ncbi:MAG TPA: radical SAM protein [Candidatus Scalindua sp.]|nr:radical SAM protein [Candidatus Scalindua sp.]